MIPSRCWRSCTSIDRRSWGALKAASAAGSVLLGLPGRGLLRIFRSHEGRLPRAPVGRAQLPALERREDPQHFPGAPAHAQVVHAEPPNLPLLVEQVGRPKRDLLDRIQNAELFGDRLVSIRQHRELEIAKGWDLLAPGEVRVVGIPTRTEHPRGQGAKLPEGAVELHQLGRTYEREIEGPEKIAVHVPSSSCESTIRNSDPGSAETQACRENSGNRSPRPSSRAMVPSDMFRSGNGTAALLRASGGTLLTLAPIQTYALHRARAVPSFPRRTMDGPALRQERL